MATYIDAEAAAAIEKSVARVRSVDELYIRYSIRTDDKFDAMHRDREGYRAVSTKDLRNLLARKRYQIDSPRVDCV